MSGRGNNRGGRGGYDNQQRGNDNQQLAVWHEPRMPMPVEAEQRYGIDRHKWKALTEAVFPSATSVDGVMMALEYCKARGLDVFKRPVHVVPMYNAKLGRTVETVWPGIAEMRTTATRTGVYAGTDACDFGRIITRGFSVTRSGKGDRGPWQETIECPEFEFPEWAQITVYKVVAGVRCAFVGPKVFFLEIFSGIKGVRVPNERWRQSPRGMLEKCAEAAALRRAFPEEIGNEMTAEEMEGKIIQQAEDEKATETTASGRDGNAISDADIAGTGGGGGEYDWSSAEVVDGFLDFIDRTLAGAHSVDAIGRARGWLDGRYADLAVTDAVKEQAEEIYQEAKSRVEARAAARERALAEQQGGGDGETQSDDGEAQPDAGESAVEDAEIVAEGADQQTARTDDVISPFVRNVTRRLDEIRAIDELDTYQKGLKRSLDLEPADTRMLVDQLLSAKRQVLAKN